MPKIRIYPDILVKDYHKTFHAREGETLHDWLCRTEPLYRDDEPPRFVTKWNGEFLEAKDFKRRHFAYDDVVDIIVRPGGPAPAWLVQAMFYISVATTAYSLYAFFTYKKPPTPKAIPQAASVYDANVQANQPRLLGVVPEHFGRHKSFPDFISVPWREYETNSQWIHLLLCVGVGEYEIDPDEIYIANTPISRYGGDAQVSIFGPDEDVSGHTAHRNVYTSKEVGSSEGSSGLDIRGILGTVGSITTGEVTANFIGVILKLRANDWALRSAAHYYGELNKIGAFDVGNFIELRTSSGVNDGKYRIDEVDEHDLTVVKMLDDFSDVDPSWTSFVTETGIKVEVTGFGTTTGGEWVGPYLACPLNEVTERIMLDFGFFQGLVYINDEGKLRNLTVEWEIEYRDANGTYVDEDDGWTTLEQEDVNSTVDPIRFTREINLSSPICPEVRVRRTSQESSTTQKQSRLTWAALKSELGARVSYPGITTIAISVKGSNILAAQSENKFSLIATRKLPELTEDGDDYWTEPVATRKISAAFAYVCHNIGLEDDRIDIATLRQYDAIWNEREDYFDGIIQSDGTFFDTLNKLLAPGYAVPVIDMNKISLVRDEPRTVYEQMFQPQNIVNGGGIEREFALTNDDEPDGIEVAYFSSETWRTEKVLALMADEPQGDIGADPQTMEAFGITDRTHAWRFGMRKRREKALRNIKHSFTTEMDALNARFMSFCALGDDTPDDWSQTGHIISADGTQLTLSDPVTFTPGVAHYIGLRRPDGTLSGPYLVEEGSEPTRVIQVSSLPDLDFVIIGEGENEEPTLYQFGTATRWTESVLITELQPEGIERVAVTAMNYDERLYENDNDPAPIDEALLWGANDYDALLYGPSQDDIILWR